MKTKNISKKMLPPVGIEPGTCALLFELTWHVLVRDSLNYFLFMHNLILGVR